MAIYYKGEEISGLSYKGSNIDTAFYKGEEVGPFKAFISIQTNAGVTVTLKLGDEVIASAGSGDSGIVSFTVKKKGTYTVSHSGLIAEDVDVTESKKTYSLNLVYIKPIDSLSAAAYSSNIAAFYWTNPSDSKYYTGVELRYATGSYPGSVSAGTSLSGGTTGESLQVSTSLTVNGILLFGMNTGTAYYVSAFSFVTISGKKYYSDTVRKASFTGAVYTGVESRSSSGVFTVPTGVRRIRFFLVGPGGGGGGATDYISDGSTSMGGGGGAGGKCTLTGWYDVIPGQQISFVVGSGGTAGSCGAGATAGGQGGATKVFSVTAAGGGGGSPSAYGTRASGGSGGSAGGRGGTYKSGSGFTDAESGGTNGESKGSATGTGSGSTTFRGVIYSDGAGGGGRSGGAAGGGTNGGHGAGGGSSPSSATQGKDGTGSGGGGAVCRYDYNKPYGSPARGGNGAVIAEW